MAVTEICLENFEGIEFKMKKSKALIGEGLAGEVAREAKKILSQGCVCLCEFDDTSGHGDVVAKALCEVGYRVKKVRFASGSRCESATLDDLRAVPEDVRLFVSVGSGSLCDIVKIVASERCMPHIVFATACSTDGYFHNFVERFEGGFRYEENVNPPEVILWDLQAIGASPQHLVAGGFGTLYSKLVAIIDEEYAVKVCRKKGIGKNSTAKIAKEIRQTLLGEYKNRDEYIFAMTRQIARVGLWEQATGVDYCLQNVESTLAVFFEKYADEGYSEGVFKFIASYLLAQVYEKLLQFGGNELLFPPNKTESMIYVSKAFGGSLANLMKNAEGTTATKYRVQSFLHNEYGADMLGEIKKLNEAKSAYSKAFRRIFDDAGYGLRNMFSTEELLQILSGCCLLCKNDNILAYYKEQGFLEYMLKCSA